MSDDKRDARGHYYGKVGSPSEHRTVGDHRAWCHDCAEWCYPSAPCGEPKCCAALDGAPQAEQVAATDPLRVVLLAHHPIMRSETGPFSGCRCGGVGLGEDVIQHVVNQVLAALKDPAEEALDRVRTAHEWQCDCEPDDPCQIRAALDGTS